MIAAKYTAETCQGGIIRHNKEFTAKLDKRAFLS
jgi:hypothetical protein